MVCPDRSLVFPALDYTRYIIMKAGHVWGKGYLPVVINGGNIQYADFTAAVVRLNLCEKDGNKKNRKIESRVIIPL